MLSLECLASRVRKMVLLVVRPEERKRRNRFEVLEGVGERMGRL